MKKNDYMNILIEKNLSITGDIICSLIEKEVIKSKNIKEVFKSTLSYVFQSTVDIFFPEAACDIQKSVLTDYIICLEDGKKVKSLKNYIKKYFNMTPEEYKKKWTLPFDYPMVASSFSQKRSQIAKNSIKDRKHKVKIVKKTIL
jgi:predicted transcriptional regulator